MRRIIAWGILALVGCSQGCFTQKLGNEWSFGSVLRTWASPARYTQKQDDEGVVAIPNNSPEYRDEALKLIEKHVGSQYRILSEDYVVRGSERKLEHLSTESPDKEYQIHYWRLDVWRRGANSLPRLGLPSPGLGYVYRDAEKGVVAVPSKKHREEALELIQKHLGTDHRIVLEEEKNSKYYIFYCKRALLDEKPPLQPTWSKGDSGKSYPGWIKGGIY